VTPRAACWLLTARLRRPAEDVRPVGAVLAAAGGAADADDLEVRAEHVRVVPGRVLPLGEGGLGAGVAGGDVLGHRRLRSAAEVVAGVAGAGPGRRAVQPRVAEVVVVPHVLAVAL